MSGEAMNKDRWLEKHSGYGPETTYQEIERALQAEPDPVRHPCKVVMVLDISGSMKGAPMTNLRMATESFIFDLHDTEDNEYGDSLGVATFDGQGEYYWGASEKVRLMETWDDVMSAADKVKSLRSSGGSTNIGSGLSIAREMLASENDRRAIILISDGDNNAGAEPEPMSEVEQLSALGIPVYTVAVGSGANQALLKAIAVENNRFHPAANSTEMTSIFHDIMDQAQITRVLYNRLHNVAHGQPDKSEWVTVPLDASRLTASVTWAEDGLQWKYEPRPTGEHELAVEILNESGDIIPQDYFKTKVGGDNCVVFDFNLNDYRPEKVQVVASTQPLNSGSTQMIPITMAVSADVSTYSLIIAQSATLVPLGVPIYYAIAVKDEIKGEPIEIGSVEVNHFSQRTIPADEFQALMQAAKEEDDSISENSAMMTAFSRWARDNGEAAYDKSPQSPQQDHEYLYSIPIESLKAGIYKIEVTVHFEGSDGQDHRLTRIATAYVYDPDSV